jgi:hypothetical protein
MPEYIFTYVIALLAHHPNFPAENNKKVKLEVYEPFQEMLDFVLQVSRPSWRFGFNEFNGFNCLW